MCVIVISKEGKKLPEEILKKCWDRNDAGAGFAVIKNNRETFTSKGYLKYDDFIKDYKLVTEGEQHVLHFRLVSAGKDNNVMTHPFILDKDMYEVDVKNIKGSINRDINTIESHDGIIQHTIIDKYALFHNGTISSFGDKERSDTFYLAYMLSHIDSNSGKYAILDNLCDKNKFCLVGKGNIYWWGDFKKDVSIGDDFMFSNLVWKSYSNIQHYNNYYTLNDFNHDVYEYNMNWDKVEGRWVYKPEKEKEKIIEINDKSEEKKTEDEKRKCDFFKLKNRGSYICLSGCSERNICNDYISVKKTFNFRRKLW